MQTETIFAELSEDNVCIEVPIEAYVAKDQSEAAVEKAAAAKGKSVRWAAKNELLIDLDSEEAYDDFILRLARLQELVKNIGFRRWESATAGHYHALVFLDREIGELERVFLEACLGSDPKRAILGWQEAMTGRENVSCFFEFVT